MNEGKRVAKELQVSLQEVDRLQESSTVTDYSWPYLDKLETSVPKDVPLNQLQQSNQRTTSTLVPPSRIKEELEEMCISQLQGLELDPTVNEDPLPDASNNSLLSRSDRERSVVLTPNHGHQLLPNSPVAESQDRSETPGRRIDTLSNKTSDDENTTSATVNEPTPNKKCKYKSQTSITGAKLTSNERRNDKNPTSEGNSESAQRDKQFNNENPTLSESSAPILHERNDGKSEAPIINTEPKQQKEFNRTTAPITYTLIMNEKPNNENPTSDKKTQTPDKRSINEKTTLNRDTESTTSAESNTTFNDDTATSVGETEITPMENLHDENLSPENGELTPNESQDDSPNSTGSIAQTTTRKHNKRKSTSVKSTDPTAKRKRSGGKAISTSSTKPPPNVRDHHGSITSARSDLATNDKPGKGNGMKSMEPASSEKQNEQSMSKGSKGLTPTKRCKVETKTLTRSTEELNNGSTESRGLEPRSIKKDRPSSDRRYRDVNSYKCDLCDKVMTNFKNYKFHMKSHTVAKTYKCETCGKMFRESWDLNKHLVIHSVEKPFKCEVCGNGFNRRYNLNQHFRVHTGEKPYNCDTCNKSFSSCVNLKKHIRIHTGEKPYTCNTCGKEFADSSAFKNHLRVHSGEKPFTCSVCQQTFATGTTLKRHSRTHTGEKPYKCNECEKAFGHRADLKVHMRIHTGEKPYKCSTCGDQFSNWLKLHRHKNNVHKSNALSTSKQKDKEINNIQEEGK